MMINRIHATGLIGLCLLTVVCQAQDNMRLGMAPILTVGKIPREPVTYDMLCQLISATRDEDTDFAALVSFRTAINSAWIDGALQTRPSTRLVGEISFGPDGEITGIAYSFDELGLFVEGEMKVIKKLHGKPPAAGRLSERVGRMGLWNSIDPQFRALVPWGKYVTKDDTVAWDAEKPVVCLAVGNSKKRILDATFIGPVAEDDVEAACKAVSVTWDTRGKPLPAIFPEEFRQDKNPWLAILGIHFSSWDGTLTHADYFQLLRTIRMAEVEPLVESQFEASGMIMAPHKGLASGLISFLNDAEKERQALVLKVILSRVEGDRYRMISALRKDPAVVKALEALIEKRKADEQWAEVVKQYAALAEALKKQPEKTTKE